jgi:hypothetical protein
MIINNIQAPVKNTLDAASVDLWTPNGHLLKIQNQAVGQVLVLCTCLLLC